MENVRPDDNFVGVASGPPHPVDRSSHGGGGGESQTLILTEYIQNRRGY